MPLQRFARWLYRGGRPGGLARVMNRVSAAVFASGRLSPPQAVTVEVTGRRSGRPVAFPMVVADYQGEQYLVSMLGPRTNWVANVAAAGGRAVVVRGVRQEVLLELVPVELRAPIIKRYLALAPGARPHVPVDQHADVSDFEAIAPDHPVYRIVPV
jgi:hypothetical protein